MMDSTLPAAPSRPRRRFVFQTGTTGSMRIEELVSVTPSLPPEPIVVAQTVTSAPPRPKRRLDAASLLRREPTPQHGSWSSSASRALHRTPKGRR
jgi:hypothetical protein